MDILINANESKIYYPYYLNITKTYYKLLILMSIWITHYYL